jgi:hypothetical protein
MYKRLSAFALIMPLLMVDSSANVKQQPKESINWSSGIIVSYGLHRVYIKEEGLPADDDGSAVISLNRGRASAYRNAREQAVARMTRLVREIRVDADTMLTDLIRDNDVVQARIARIIANRMKVTFYPVDFFTSGCRAELKIGDLLHAVPYKYPADDFPVGIDNPIPTDYTSLVIDARGLRVEPMMLPSVFSENGLEVYGRHYVDIRHSTRFGIVGYAFNEDDALKSPLAGERPLYTAALGVLKGCPVLSHRDVRKMFSSDNTIGHLKKCKVIFIIDKVKK